MVFKYILSFALFLQLVTSHPFVRFHNHGSDLSSIRSISTHPLSKYLDQHKRNGKDFLLPTDKRRQHIQPIINENPLLDKIDLFELRRILRIPDTEEIQRYQNWGNLRNYFEDVTDEFEDWIKSKSPPSTYIFRQI